MGRAYRSAIPACAIAALTSGSSIQEVLGGVRIAATARSKASWFALDGLVVPAILRTMQGRRLDLVGGGGRGRVFHA